MCYFCSLVTDPDPQTNRILSLYSKQINAVKSRLNELTLLTVFINTGEGAGGGANSVDWRESLALYYSVATRLSVGSFTRLKLQFVAGSYHM